MPNDARIGFDDALDRRSLRTPDLPLEQPDLDPSDLAMPFTPLVGAVVPIQKFLSRLINLRKVLGAKTPNQLSLKTLRDVVGSKPNAISKLERPLPDPVHERITKRNEGRFHRLEKDIQRRRGALTPLIRAKMKVRPLDVKSAKKKQKEIQVLLDKQKALSNELVGLRNRFTKGGITGQDIRPLDEIGDFVDHIEAEDIVLDELADLVMRGKASLDKMSPRTRSAVIETLRKRNE